MVRCKLCGHAYPSDTYPSDQALQVTAPDCERHVYPYHEGRLIWWKGDEPYRSYFAARVDYHKIRYLEQSANTSRGCTRSPGRRTTRGARR